jgi:BarA-like signal transduction histidine kinase
MYKIEAKNNIFFENLTQEEAEKKALELKHMIMVGVPSTYTVEDIQVVKIK